ncbi:hypothetical protein ACOSQ4_008893 [Xanthoceras sorbifolium]
MLPDSVSDFLADETFVRDYVYDYWIDSLVELSELAVRVLKKPNLSTCGLADLAREVGIDAEASSSSSTGSSSAPGSSNAPNWETIVFTDQQINDAIQIVSSSTLFIY